jgi:hypothetical protein
VASVTVPATLSCTVSSDDLPVSDPAIDAPAGTLRANLERCHFCGRPLPRFARLRTLCGWGFG